MPTFEPPPQIKRAAENLHVALIESGGDLAEVSGSLDAASRACRAAYGETDGPRMFGLVVGSATTLFFTVTWPAVLAQLEAHGVTGDAVATGINTAIAQQLSDYLRTDVKAGEV